MASIRKRTKKDGSSSYMLWRDPKSREQQAITVPTLVEAETLKRLLNANGQSFEIAQHAILSNEKRTPSVADVVQEHIDLLIRPSSGTTKTYRHRQRGGVVTKALAGAAASGPAPAGALGVLPRDVGWVNVVTRKPDQELFKTSQTPYGRQIGVWTMSTLSASELVVQSGRLPWAGFHYWGPAYGPHCRKSSYSG